MSYDFPSALFEALLDGGGNINLGGPRVVGMAAGTQSRLRDLEARYRHLMGTVATGPLEDFVGVSAFAAQYLETLKRNKEYQHRLAKAERDGRISTLVNNDDMNELLANEFYFREKEWMNNKHREQQKALPIHQSRVDIVNAVRKERVVIISGATGSGKSTQVPQYILDDHMKNGQGSVCRILVSQPRRISTLAVAKQVSKERGEQNTFCYHDEEYWEELQDQGVLPLADDNLHASVGFETRDAKMKPRSYGSITYCTTGTILVSYLNHSPLLADVSHIVIDEVHERQLETDFLVAVMKQVLKQRSDIKLVLMSASMDTAKFSRYFWNCPVIEVPGRLFPVKEIYLEDILNEVSFKPGEGRETSLMLSEIGRDPNYSCYDRDVLRHIASVEGSQGELDLHFIERLVLHVHRCDPELTNAILVFLPGWEAIRGVDELLDRMVFELEVHRLHSDVPLSEQEMALEPPTGRKRKVVLSTNVAEISITIPDVVYVIDCGFINTVKYVKSTNSKALSPEWEGRSNAIQRAGRAGRVKAGTCYYLFSRARLAKLQQYVMPDIFRVPLTETVLHIKRLGLGDAAAFLGGMMDAPEAFMINGARRRLCAMGALDEREVVTPLGYHLIKLPIEPNLGKMAILGAMTGCLDVVVSAAASLSEKKPFSSSKKVEDKVRRMRTLYAADSKSDHIMLANVVLAYEKASDKFLFCQDSALSQSNLARVCRLKRIITRQLKSMGFVSSNRPSALSSNGNCGNTKLHQAVIAAALEPGVGVINNQQSGRYPVFMSSHPEEQKMFLGFNSVNKDKSISSFVDLGICYHDKMKNRKKNIQLYDNGVFNIHLFMYFSNAVLPWKKQSTRWVSKDGFLQVDGGGEEALDKHMDFVAKMIGMKLRDPRLDWTMFMGYLSELMQI